MPLGTAARQGCGSVERVEIFQMRWIASRFTSVEVDVAWAGRAALAAPGGLSGFGISPLVRFAWRSSPNGLYQKKAKIYSGVSLLGRIGEVLGFLFRPSPGPGRAGDR